MKKIDKLSVRYHDRQVGVLSLTPDNRLCAFEYDRRWLVDGFSISPFELPLKSGLFIAKPDPFSGDFGVFEDSLPDGYGRYLMHKVLLRQGINDFDLSALERLSFVGNGGMGALEYYPQIPLHKDGDISDFDALQEKALEVLREKNDDDAGLLLFNSRNSGGCRPKALFSDMEGHWLVKFRHTYDPENMGIREYEYNDLARSCGIHVPDFKLVNGRYFACRRFDIALDGERLHVVTAGGLLRINLSNPVLDYSNLLGLTGYLTQDASAVEEMYRRMVFNYLMDNKDDHCKNFSFICLKNSKDEWCWNLAPAYDLTLCTEGYNGEHATSVNGTGHPQEEDFIKLGTDIKMTRERCMELIRQVEDGCRRKLK